MNKESSVAVEPGHTADTASELPVGDVPGSAAPGTRPNSSAADERDGGASQASGQKNSPQHQDPRQAQLPVTATGLSARSLAEAAAVDDLTGTAAALRLFISRLPSTCTPKRLREYFVVHLEARGVPHAMASSAILDVYMPTGPTGRLRNFAFVSLSERGFVELILGTGPGPGGSHIIDGRAVIMDVAAPRGLKVKQETDENGRLKGTVSMVDPVAIPPKQPYQHHLAKAMYGRKGSPGTTDRGDGYGYNNGPQGPMRGRGQAPFDGHPQDGPMLLPSGPPGQGMAPGMHGRLAPHLAMDKQGMGMLGRRHADQQYGMQQGYGGYGAPGSPSSQGYGRGMRPSTAPMGLNGQGMNGVLPVQGAMAGPMGLVGLQQLQQQLASMHGSQGLEQGFATIGMGPGMSVSGPVSPMGSPVYAQYLPWGGPEGGLMGQAGMAIHMNGGPGYGPGNGQ